MKWKPLFFGNETCEVGLKAFQHGNKSSPQHETQNVCLIAGSHTASLAFNCQTCLINILTNFLHCTEELLQVIWDAIELASGVGI